MALLGFSKGPTMDQKKENDMCGVNMKSQDIEASAEISLRNGTLLDLESLDPVLAGKSQYVQQIHCSDLKKESKKRKIGGKEMHRNKKKNALDASLQQLGIDQVIVDGNLSLVPNTKT